MLVYFLGNFRNKMSNCLAEHYNMVLLCTKELGDVFRFLNGKKNIPKDAFKFSYSCSIWA